MSRLTIQRLRVAVALFGLTICFILLRLTVPHFGNQEIRRQVRDFIIMRPGAAENSYRRFVISGTSDETIYYTRFYFFNITNLEEIRTSGAKPVLEELGPYTYQTQDQKYDIAFHWNGSLSYKEMHYYYRDPSMTKGSFDDRVVTLNLALVGCLGEIKSRINNKFLEKLVTKLATKINSHEGNHNDGLFMSRTVEELLWGYEDPVLKTASQFTPIETTFSFMNNASVADTTPVSMIHTGLDDVSKIGQFEMSEGLTQVEWNNHSEKVSGTSGTFFRPFISEEDTLSIWIRQMYRKVPLYRSGKSKMLGVDMFRYKISPDFWKADSRYFSSNDGLINTTHTSLFGRPGPPLFFSPPHFCGSDPVLRQGVLGLDCNVSRTDSFIDVEPYTGISLRAMNSFMISTQFPTEYKSIEPDLKNTIVPVFWLEMVEEASMEQTDPIRNKLYWALNLKHVVTLVATILILFFGLVAVGYTILVLISHRRSLRNYRLHGQDHAVHDSLVSDAQNLDERQL